jgi:hypothetical protein
MCTTRFQDSIGHRLQAYVVQNNCHYITIIYIIIKSGLASTCVGYSESSESNGSEQATRQVASPLNGTCASLPTCSRLLGLKFALAHILVYGLVCDVFSSKFVTHSQLLRSASKESLLCFSSTKMELLPAVTGACWLSMENVVWTHPFCVVG